MFDLRLELGTHSTQVKVEPHVLARTGELLRTLLGGATRLHTVVVTDRSVGDIYGPTLHESLAGAGFLVLDYAIEPGETSKSLSVAGDLYRFLARHAVARDAVVVALGGGVVSDLAGFVAATWMRGVRFVVCPTTLEADIDACIGGKTAVNLPEAKNLVGAFHQPILVAVDPVCLATLDARDVRAGLAESIKHALISPGAFLAWHEANADAILLLDEEVITELILANLRIKAGIVEQDTTEQTGLRARLNFGHTIGHAIESSCGFEMRHGECVALGILAACRLSSAMGLLHQSVVERVESVLERFGLPTRLPDPGPCGTDSQATSLVASQLAGPVGRMTDKVMGAIRYDKKVRGGAQQFVLLEGVGRPTIRSDIPERAVREAYESLLR